MDLRAIYKVKYWMGLAILFVAGCVTPFPPPASSQTANVLVVEGFINTNGPTNIQLSRSTPISKTAGYVPELGAEVTVEEENGNEYPLTETGNGNYSLDTLSNINDSVRLSIRTSNGQQFLSDYVLPQTTPPIDSISWYFLNGGVQIAANTHGPSGMTSYYHWNYYETWEFHSYYRTLLAYQNGQVVFAPQDTLQYRCWHSDSSEDILLGTSAGLAQNVISQEPLVFIPPHSNEMSVEYSIIVSQYAVSQEEYNFWLSLKSNTQTLGTIFDPLPSTNTGNLYCLTQSSQTVIGYIGAGTVQEERIFINNDQMPMGWNLPPDCPEVVVAGDSISYFFGPSLVPVAQDGVSNYYGAMPECVYCTLKGTETEPTYWP